ncbi:PREDICTED: uncharacterized protein LOC106750888 [Dinoponera quadriceps]|uniref:Uncharacterized protein LOC106750888 n=1 Tax=Dinoponera quadriceps TaxID=609295 RepID=A0A6P3YAK7_DINQU|nr:PREDICTED: uncharacterized protein LOC106750888 [Dinoponera quadriceps]
MGKDSSLSVAKGRELIPLYSKIYFWHHIIMLFRYISPRYMIHWLRKLLSAGRLEMKILKHLHGFTEKIIAERKLYHKQMNGRYLKIIENNDVTETGGEEIYGST